MEKDAQELADTLHVKIFQADIIYHLFDKFIAYQDELKAKKRDEFKQIAVFPCKLKVSYIPTFHTLWRDNSIRVRFAITQIHVSSSSLQVLPQHIFKSRDPIVMGVMVENGIVKVGTPICVPSKSVSIFCNLLFVALPTEQMFRGTEKRPDWLARLVTIAQSAADDDGGWKLIQVM